MINLVDKFVYGPFSSRRLGLSLGINLLGNKKKCTFNCVYCEIGRSTADEIVGIDFKHDPRLMLDEFKKACHEAEITVETIGYVNEHVL